MDTGLRFLCEQPYRWDVFLWGQPMFLMQFSIHNSSFIIHNFPPSPPPMQNYQTNPSSSATEHALSPTYKTSYVLHRAVTLVLSLAVRVSCRPRTSSASSSLFQHLSSGCLPRERTPRTDGRSSVGPAGVQSFPGIHQKLNLNFRLLLNFFNRVHSTERIGRSEMLRVEAQKTQQGNGKTA